MRSIFDILCRPFYASLAVNHPYSPVHIWIANLGHCWIDQTIAADTGAGHGNVLQLPSG